MMFRPATPGFIVTLIATALLIAVSFSVPYIKSVFFLKASLTTNQINTTFTFGVLGYCVDIGNSNTTCSSPHVGWEFNPNQLLGDSTILQIPTVVVKWLTYVLVLHIVGMVLAAISAVFGLLAHVREMSMTCFSSCISGFAATVTMVAFIFDLVLFFLVKGRINDISGSSAVIGVGVWLTLIAWILLFFSGCFYRVGRCCISRSPRAPRDKEYNRPATDPNYGDQMHLDAVKAEADRKARQKQAEGGLPAFAEYDQAAPLTSKPQFLEEEEEEDRPYRDDVPPGAGRRQGSQSSNQPAGYAPGPPGGRAVDEYYTPSRQQNSYPPQPVRQPSGHSQGPSSYGPSTYNNHGAGVGAVAVGVSSAAAHAQYPSQYSHNPNQYSSQGYGHQAGGTSYHSAQSHQQYPTNYSQTMNQYSDQGAFNQQPSAFNADTYNNTGLMTTTYTSTYNDPYAQNASQNPNFLGRPPSAGPTTSYHSDNSNSQYYSAAATPGVQERAYTLGGGGYGDNTVPDVYGASSTRAYTASPSPAPINTNLPYASGPASPRGPRGPRSSVHLSPTREDLPVYDESTAQPPGMWNSKR